MGHHGAVRWRSACALRGWGGATRRTLGATVVRLQKVYQTRSYGFVPPFYSPFGHDQAYNRISGQMSTKPTWRRLAPLVLGLGRRLGGGAAPRSFDHQIRAHGQIHRHVSFMNASGVQIIGGKLQVSRPAWCPPPPLTLLVAPQACGPPARRPNHCLNKCHYVPKLIHSQADSFTGEFHPSRGLCGYALLLSSGNVPVTGALPDPPSSRKHVDLQRRGPIIV